MGVGIRAWQINFLQSGRFSAFTILACPHHVFSSHLSSNVFADVPFSHPSTQTYIAELLEMVRAVFGTVKAMKGNLKEVERIMKAAAAKPLIQVRGARLPPKITANTLEGHADLCCDRVSQTFAADRFCSLCS